MATDLKISATTGQTGGPALSTDQTTMFLRKDGTYQNPFLPQHTQVPATPGSGVSPYSSAGGNSLLGGGAMDAFVNGQGLVVESGGIVPGSVLTAASTLASFTSEAQLTGLSIPANDPVAGAVYYMRMGGLYSDTGTPTFAFGLRYGGAGGTSIAAIAAITLGSGVTSVPWEAECILQFWSTVLATGVIRLGLGTSASTGATSLFCGSAAAAGVTVVSTSAKVMSFTVTCSASSSSNTISALTGYGARLA